MTKRQINRAVFIWLLCYASVSYAASTLRADIAGYDWLSLVLAGMAGALGGVARTIVSLLTDKRPVLDLKIEAAKDVCVALVGGLMVYVIIGGYNSFAHEIELIKLPQITRDFRILLLVYAGFSRGKWLGAADNFAADAIDNVRQKLRGGAPVTPSAIVPLEDTPK